MSLLDKRIKSLLEGLSSALARLGDEVSPKSVHSLRTTIRRIESVVAYTSPDLGRKQQRALKNLATLRKRAGKVRDLDVQLTLLGAIANGSTSGDRHTLEDLLKRKRSKQVERVTTAIGKHTKLLAHFERIGEKVVTVSEEATVLPIKEARRQLSSLAAEFISRQPIQPRFLHQVRTRMKKVRYLAELGKASPEQRRLLETLKSTQDALGAWHDWELLAETTEKQFGGRVNCPLLVEVRALFAAKYSAATAAVRQLFSLDSATAVRKEARSAEAPRALAQPA
jgi:CHAD domain-containing protein